MVGEAQGAAVLAELTLLGWPGTRRVDDVEAADEQVVDRVGGGGGGEAEAVAERVEDGGGLGGTQVEVAAEDQRRVACPGRRRLRGAQHVFGRELGSVVGGVQVGDTEIRRRAGAATVEAPCADPRERHRPALRPPVMDRPLASLDDPVPSAATYVPIWHRTNSGRIRPVGAANEGQVRAALAGGDEVGI